MRSTYNEVLIFRPLLLWQTIGMKNKPYWANIMPPTPSAQLSQVLNLVIKSFIFKINEIEFRNYDLTSFSQNYSSLGAPALTALYEYWASHLNFSLSKTSRSGNSFFEMRFLFHKNFLFYLIEIENFSGS